MRFTNFIININCFIFCFFKALFLYFLLFEVYFSLNKVFIELLIFIEIETLLCKSGRVIVRKVLKKSKDIYINVFNKGISLIYIANF